MTEKNKENVALCGHKMLNQTLKLFSANYVPRLNSSFYMHLYSIRSSYETKRHVFQVLQAKQK